MSESMINQTTKKDTSSIKTELVQLIADGKHVEVLNALSPYCEESGGDLSNTLTLLCSQFSQFELDNIKGVMTHSESTILRSRLIDSLITLVNRCFR
jgi:Effector-associated domain 11